MTPDEKLMTLEASRRMRAAFFSVFGSPQEMTKEQETNASLIMGGIYASELVEWVAHSFPDKPLRETIMNLIESYIASTRDRNQ